MDKMRKDKDKEIASIIREKDTQISKERHKVAKVLTALQDAEVKKREVEAIKKGLKKVRAYKSRNLIYIPRLTPYSPQGKRETTGGGKSVDMTSKAKKFVNRF